MAELGNITTPPIDFVIRIQVHHPKPNASYQEQCNRFRGVQKGAEVASSILKEWRRTAKSMLENDKGNYELNAGVLVVIAEIASALGEIPALVGKQIDEWTRTFPQVTNYEKTE